MKRILVLEEEELSRCKRWQKNAALSIKGAARALKKRGVEVFSSLRGDARDEVSRALGVDLPPGAELHFDEQFPVISGELFLSAIVFTRTGQKRECFVVAFPLGC